MNIDFLHKLKTKKIVALFVSILIVIIVLLNSTYSLLIREDETEVQSYTTGILEITSSSTNNSVTLTNSFPMSDSDGANLEPYTFKIENTGNLTYNFNVMLLSTSTENQINANYIRLSADGGTPVTLGDLTNGVFLSDVTLHPGQSIEIELRVWLDENTKNSELGKVFNGKIVTEGQAVYTESNNPALTTLTNLGLSVSEGTPDFSKTSCSSGCGETTIGIYEMEDDLGTSYYFRGNVANNYVYFAGYYWRIIRINGDGSIRMIYQGTTATATGDSAQLDTKYAWYSSYNDNAYVGYMYGTPGSSTYDATHANINDTLIKDATDAWYQSNLLDYSEYISDSGFCGDRTLTSGTGIGTAETYYGAYNRLINNKTPSLKCTNSNDLYTTESATFGNKVLTYPIGHITADEVALAGSVSTGTSGTENTSYYLYTGSNYRTMTPYAYDVSSSVYYASVYGVDTSGIVRRFYKASTEQGVRPVINLRGDLNLIGTGTMEDPFRLSGIEAPSVGG